MKKKWIVGIFGRRPMTLTVRSVLSLLVVVTSFAGCRPTFDMRAYQDSLREAYEGGGTIPPSDLLSQSIVSSELVSVTIPPGVYADHGILLYREGKFDEALEQITKESEHYPESKRFVQSLLALVQKAKPELQIPASFSRGRSPSILILPPLNKSGRSEAGSAFDMSLSRPFIERGYYVFPVLSLQVLAQKYGVETGNNSDAESSFLKEATGADAVLSVSITEWKYTKIVDPRVRVAAEYRLVDATTGRNIWECTVRDAFGYMVYAMLGSRHPVSDIDLRIPAYLLTRKAITSRNNELPFGPYYSGGFYFNRW